SLSGAITDAEPGIWMVTRLSEILSSSTWLAPKTPSLPIMPVSIAPPPTSSTTQEMIPECGKYTRVTGAYLAARTCPDGRSTTDRCGATRANEARDSGLNKSFAECGIAVFLSRGDFINQRPRRIGKVPTSERAVRL